MPKAEYATCRNCGRHRDEVGTMTRSRLCVICWPLIERENALAISTKTGPYHEHRLRRMLMYANKALLDAQRADA